MWTHAVNSEILETIVEQAIQLSSTDIHLQCGEPIYLRHGDGLKATSVYMYYYLN